MTPGKNHVSSPAVAISLVLALAYESLHDNGGREVMIIGGAEIFREALPLADRIYLTEIHRAYAGETVLASDLIGPDWHELSRERHAPEAPDGPAYSFVTLA